MKTTKEKIGLTMLAIIMISALAIGIIGAFIQSFWIGIAVIVVLLYFSIMIKCLFNE